MLCGEMPTRFVSTLPDTGFTTLMDCPRSSAVKTTPAPSRGNGAPVCAKVAEPEATRASARRVRLMVVKPVRDAMVKVIVPEPSLLGWMQMLLCTIPLLVA